MYSLIFLLAACLLYLFFFQRELVTELWLSFYASKVVFYSVLSIVFVLFLLFIFIKFDLMDFFLSFYRLDVNGLLIFESTGRGEEIELEELKNELSSFQSKYDFLQYNIDFSLKAVKVEVKTPGTVTVKKGEKILDRLVEDLNSIIGSTPAEHLLMNINIEGEVKNLSRTIDFVVANNRDRVGIKKNMNKNMIFKVYSVEE